MAITADTNRTAVIAFVEAYIGGKKLNGSTLGILTVNNNATTTGTKIDTIIINQLYNLTPRIFYSLNNFKRSSLRIEISSDSPFMSNFSLKSTEPL